MRLKDLTGKRFGRLTVAWPAGRTFGRDIKWLCFCDCGKFKTLFSYHLKSGGTRSCGCLITKKLKRGLNRVHGMTNSPEFIAYCAAKQRCTNPRDQHWKDYGGRGIQFKFESFVAFYKELGKRPKKHSLDRIDNDGNYEPGNVRWATQKEQISNQRPRKKRVA